MADEHVEAAAALTVKIFDLKHALIDARTGRDEHFRALRETMTAEQVAEQVSQLVREAGLDPRTLGCGRDSVRRAWLTHTKH